MIPKGVVKFISKKLFYRSEVAMYSSFVALFTRELEGGTYVHNSRSMMHDTWLGRYVFGVYSGRGGKPHPVLKVVFFIAQCFYQTFSYKDVMLTPPNIAVLDSKLTQRLFEWSKTFTK